MIARVNNKVCEVVHASAKATGPVSSETIVTSSSEVIAKALAEPVREKLKPKPHQKEASKAVVQGFQAADRGQLILPCGAGKTYTALQIKEKMQAKTTLCVVPSIPLVSQMKNAWLNDKKKDFDYLCVCSDPSVNSVEQGEETEKEFKELKQEAREKVTTNVEDIVKYIKTKRKNDSVIFVTYDSVPKIKQALEHTKTEFDLAIIDEAHNTAGANDKVVSPIHSNADIAIKKRLYMTATPKVHSKRDEAKVAAGEILSMSDEKIFGREFHRMSFAKAIEKGILVDYKIIAVGIDEDELFRTNKHLPEEERKHKAYSRALKKVMDKYGTSHALTFHSRIKGSKEFTSFHNGQFPQEVECFHVDGSMPVKERNRLIGVFEKIEGKQAVLSNAQCLTEGIDVPGIDAVYFSEPKKSLVDIVQATGRALRKSKAKPNKTGYVFIPVIKRKGKSLQGTVKTTDYKYLVHVITALADHDERLAARIKSPSKPKIIDDKDQEGDKKAALSEAEGMKMPELIDLTDLDSSSFNDAAITDEVLACSRILLTGSRFNNFAEFKDAVKLIYPKEPSNININSFWSKLLDRGITQRDGFILAKQEGLIDDSVKQFTKNIIAQLIWREESIDEVFAKIRTLSKDKPIDFERFVQKEAGKVSKLNINFDALKTRLRDAYPHAFLFDSKISWQDIADLAWDCPYKDFESIKIQILKDQPGILGRQEGLPQFIVTKYNLGLNYLTSLIKKAGLMGETINKEGIMALIWGKGVKPLTQFDKLINEYRKRYPLRPDDAIAILSKNLKELGGLGSYLDRAEKILGIPSDVARPKDGGAYHYLAHLIWPPEETREDLIARLKAVYVENESEFNSKKDKIKDTVELLQRLGFNYLSFSHLRADAAMRGLSDSDFLKVISRAENFDETTGYLKSIYSDLSKTKPSLDLVLNDMNFERNYGIKQTEFYQKVLNPLRSIIQGKEIKTKNKYLQTKALMELMGLSHGKGSLVNNEAALVIKTKEPVRPRDVAAMINLMNKADRLGIGDEIDYFRYQYGLFNLESSNERSGRDKLIDILDAIWR